MTLVEQIPPKNKIEEVFKSLNIPQDKYFLTGSRALDDPFQNFQISSFNSDYDYVVSIKYNHFIIQWLYENKTTIEASNYNGGFKFNYEGNIYNIICVIDIEFCAWREALGILQYLIGTNKEYRKVIADKMSRYCLYENLRAIIKSTLNIGERLK